MSKIGGRKAELSSWTMSEMVIHIQGQLALKKNRERPCIYPISDIVHDYDVFEYESVVRSRASSFGHSYPDPGSAHSELDRNQSKLTVCTVV